MAAKRLTAEERRRLFARAGHRCEYCLTPGTFSRDPLSVEHIVLRSGGGSATGSNLAIARQGCNNHKYTKVEAEDPATGLAVPLFHPRNQRWEDHFSWSEDYISIIGLTPVGRATVAAMRLNRPGLVSLRRVLFLAGEHPPDMRSGRG